PRPRGSLERRRGDNIMGDASNPHGPQRWRARTDGPVPGRAEPRSGRPILTVLACMFLLAGAIAGLLYWLRKPPKPHFVAVWVDQYTDRHIPPNGWSTQDRQALLALEWQGVHRFGR